MNLRYTIDPGTRMVRIEYLGQPDFPEWAAMMRAIFGDPNYQPGFGFLSDRRSVAEPPTSAYIRQVSDFVIDHQEQLRGSRLAMVVGGPATFGMARMSGERISRTGIEQAVFTDPGEAMRWLVAGRPPEAGSADAVRG